MKNWSKVIILLVMVTPLRAELWPSPATADPGLGLLNPAAGRLTLHVNSLYLHNNAWADRRTGFGAALGLGNGLGIAVRSSARDLSGYNAFQRGIEDTRLGLSWWPAAAEHVSVGINGNFIVPTGFREQHTYYDPIADSTRVLPAFSLGRTGGELYGGMAGLLGPAARVNVFAGYFSTSDQLDQAFRWGLGAWVAPFGLRYAAEFGYAQSLVRTGGFPSTDVFSAALAAQLPWNITAVPGLWADLSNRPTYGVSLGLRFSAPLPAAAFRAPDQMAVPLPRVNGMLLVAPPVATIDLADRDALWRSIQTEMRPSFDAVLPLPSLDRPGLPYNDNDVMQREQTIRAIAEAYPEAQWLLISRVEREDVIQQGGFSIPLIVQQPQWIAHCRLNVQLVNLRDRGADRQQLIEVRAVRRDSPLVPVVSKPEGGMLSMSESRALTFEAYREAGREIARELTHAQ